MVENVLTMNGCEMLMHIYVFGLGHIKYKDKNNKEIVKFVSNSTLNYLKCLAITLWENTNTKLTQEINVTFILINSNFLSQISIKVLAAHMFNEFPLQIKGLQSLKVTKSVIKSIFSNIEAQEAK